jgi:hypothetical protein
VADHFVDINTMVDIGSGAQRATKGQAIALAYRVCPADQPDKPDLLRFGR